MATLESPALREIAVTSLQKVLYPTDFTPTGANAFHHALRISLAAKAELELLHVEPPDTEVDWAEFPNIRATLSQWGRLPPEASKADLDATGIRVKKVLRTGIEPVETITRFVQKRNPDLVVLSTHQRQGLNRLLRHSLAEPIARQTSTLTLFVPRQQKGFVDANTGRVDLRCILVPVDRQPAPELVLDSVAVLARTLEAAPVKMVVLHVGADRCEPRLTDNLPPQWSLVHEQRNGQVVEQILAAAREYDAKLIAMATAGHQGFLDALRGSTTEQVLRMSPCPVLAVPTTARK